MIEVIISNKKNKPRRVYPPMTNEAKKSLDLLHVRDLTKETKSQFERIKDQITHLAHEIEKNQIYVKHEDVNVVYIGDGSLFLNSQEISNTR